MKFSFSSFSSYLAFIHCFHISNLCQNKCLNNGTCIINSEDKRESCLCTTAFTGDRCQINIDECSSSPCLHGGLCIDGLGEFICSCREGKQRETKINKMCMHIRMSSIHILTIECSFMLRFHYTWQNVVVFLIHTDNWISDLQFSIELKYIKKSRICTYVVILEINEYTLSLSLNACSNRIWNN